MKKILISIFSLFFLLKILLKKIVPYSKTNSIYIVKPKMHGPEECSFTNLIFEKVEKVLKLRKNQILVGIMDEERRTSVNLKECIRVLKNRVFLLTQDF